MPTFSIYTLGCKLNQLESEAIADTLVKVGLKEFVRGKTRIFAEELEIKKDDSTIDIDCDFPSLIIVNTCTVTSKADQKARRVIRKVLRDYPDSKVIVTGCYAQLNKDDIEKLDEGNPKRLSVIGKDEILNNALESSPRRTAGADSAKIKRGTFAMRTDGSMARLGFRGPFQFNPAHFSEHTRSFLKIQDGCDKHCTYCRIRLARGKSVSLEADEVLSRLQVLEQNHAEAVLTGVNICQYKDLKNFYHGELQLKLPGVARSNLPDLLAYLLSNTEKINIRLSSLAPDSVDEQLVKVFSNKRIRPHFHLSIQSCSNKILEKMGRTYNAKTVEKAVSLLRNSKENPFLACDIITGFPGETEIEFEETFNICKKLNFAWIHVFPYSKRPGTPAFSFKGNVPEREATRRVQLFTDLAKQGRANYIERWLGKEVEVLIEKGEVREVTVPGVTENYLKVFVKYNGEKPLPGTVLRCKLRQKDTDMDIDALAES